MEEVKFFVEGKIVAKQRPRVTMHGTYTPKKTLDYEAKIRNAYLKVNPDKLNGALSVMVIAQFEVPKSATKSKKQGLIDGTWQCTVKPDLDNVLKSVLDGLNGVAYEDDKNVVHAEAYKRYGSKEMLAVCIKKVGEVRPW